MIVSINWLKQFTEISGSVDELATLVGARLVEIEEVENLGKKYQGVIIAKVVECHKLEGSDHLNVTKIDDGGVAESVERDENGYVQVVCGAPNVRAGLQVAWLPPQSTVPETFNDKEPFVLGARKLRGVMSNGMLASAKELDLFEDHTGILEIDKDVAAGTSFADAYELNDYLLDIENKSLTHRPDTFGIIGFAREVAGIQGRAFETPAWLKNTSPAFIEKTDDFDTPYVTIDAPELSKRYQAVVLSGIDSHAQSSLEIQTYLARVGVRPISAVVDITNYLMMLTGQPLHAFDYDKLCALNGGRVDIHVRAGRKGEALKLLDERVVELSDNDIVIANGDIPVALAGAMGGADTEVDHTTKNILLESATFNLYNLRNTQMRHGIFSEAITRFTKGQPAALTAPVLAAAVQLLHESAGAQRVSDVADCMSAEERPARVNVTLGQINDTLGSKFTASDIVETLNNVEFDVETGEDPTSLVVTAPYWRADIHIAEDIIEEVGRLNGFDSIEPTLPTRDFTAVSPSEFDEFRGKVRAILARAGANEVLTYSFVHGDLLQKSNQNIENSYRITNSISPDLQYYRQTLTPSLLGLVHPNIKSGFSDFALFELNKTHQKTSGLNGEEVPVETDFLALTVAHKASQKGASYYEAKKYLIYLAGMCGIHDLVYTPLPNASQEPLVAPFEYRRSSVVSDKHTGVVLGVVGEYTSSVSKAFKLPAACAGFEINPHALLEASKAQPSSYRPISRYPSAERDVCYQVVESVAYAAIYEAARGVSFQDVTLSIDTLDIYQASDSLTKNITLRFTLTPNLRTLTSEDVSTMITEINNAVIARTQATII